MQIKPQKNSLSRDPQNDSMMKLEGHSPGRVLNQGLGF